MSPNTNRNYLPLMSPMSHIPSSSLSTCPFAPTCNPSLSLVNLFLIYHLKGRRNFYHILMTTGFLSSPTHTETDTNHFLLLLLLFLGGITGFCCLTRTFHFAFFSLRTFFHLSLLFRFLFHFLRSSLRFPRTLTVYVFPIREHATHHVSTRASPDWRPPTAN